VRGEDLSCEAEACRRRLLLAGDLSRKLPSSQKQDFLPAMVLTGIPSPPYAKSWPSHCQRCSKTPPQ
jgi:hypothetical protein